MKPQKQLIKHDPENGKFGDCYRTCVAIVLGLNAEDVPHVYDGPDGSFGEHDGTKAMREFLKTKKLALSQSVYNGNLTWDSFASWMHLYNKDVACIVTGLGPRGNNHAIVMIGGNVFCDPFWGMPEEVPFVGPATGGEPIWWVETIVPAAPHNHPS